MSQTKKSSLTEAFANILPGYWINYVANLVFLPIFCGSVVDEVSKHDGTGLFFTMTYIGILYTFVSIARQYLLRRLFNRYPKSDLYSIILSIKQRLKI